MSFFSRLWLAVVLFFRMVFDANFAARVLALRSPRVVIAPAATSAQGPAAAANDGVSTALHLLATLQREGRLVDFLEEEIAAFSDEEVGAAARAVHTGCRKALRGAITLMPVLADAEGARVQVPKGFDAGAIRLTGRVVGDPPFSGVLRHHGWRVAQTRIATPTRDEKILAPAEVELT